MTEQLPAAALEGARFEGLAKQVRIVSRRTRKTNKNLLAHVEECAKLQRWVLRGVVFIAGWVVTTSPEAAAAFVKLMQVVLP